MVGEVDCIDHGRRHVDLIIGGCNLRKALLWIVVPDDASGPELDPETVRGVAIAVTGKIESSGGTPQITIRSTTQIQPRTAFQTDYIGRAYDKETHGDLDGAIQDLEQAIEHQPARRDEACQHLAKLKAQKGDWAGALAAYERLIALDPNNSGSYYVRATAKKQHGDFEGAMADYEKAAEIRSSASGYIQMGDWRKEKGDITGAAAEYDKAIALCNRQIAGTAQSDAQSPLGSDPYFNRGYAKELKGDLDGALADYSQAIANNPARAGMAYGARGNIRRARGDLSGAISDYEHKYQITHYPDDKQKLEQTRAEAKTSATKGVVTQPGIPKQNEASLNRGDVTPESIAEAFVQAYSGSDVGEVAGLYADRVNYTNNGVISNAAVLAQAKEYFARWPVRQWRLVGTVNTVPVGANRQKVVFSANYDASNPQINKHASGIAQEILILATNANGGMKIVSQKEQTSKRSSSQPSQAAVNSGPDRIWSEVSPDKKLLATIRFVQDPDQNCRACDELKITVFRSGRDSKPGQMLASTSLEGRFLQNAHWSPDSQFLLFTTSLSRGAHGGWHCATFVYCAGDHSFRGDLEDVFGNVLAPDFSFESPDIAVLTVSDDQAPPRPGEDLPSKQVKVSLGKITHDPTQIIETSESPDAKISVSNESPDTNSQNAAVETNSTSNGNDDKPADSAIKQRLVGYWKFPKAVCYIAGDGKMYVGPRKNETETSHWNVKDGKFYWDNVSYTIVSLTDNKFVFREIGSQGGTLTLIRSTKEEVDPK
jgi:tetratricopeptide (TPR) repeat protein